MATITNFFKAVSHIKDDKFTDAEYEKDYIPFLVNRSLSFHADTVLVVNELNTRSFIDNKNQFRFLNLIIPKRKRNPVWIKQTKDKDLKLVSDYYGISLEKTEIYMKILFDEQLESIKEKMNKGGRTK